MTSVIIGQFVRESHWSVYKERVIRFAVFRRKNSSKVLTDIVMYFLFQYSRINLLFELRQPV